MVYGLYMAGGRSRYLPSTNLTINGQTVAADFAYAGGSDGGCNIASGWNPHFGGGLLSIAGSGGYPTINKRNTLHNSGRVWQAASASVGDVALEDFVFEVILRVSPTTNIRSFSKRAAAGGSGWRLIHQVAVSGALHFTLQSGGSYVFVVAGGSGLSREVVHGMLFADRSGHAQWGIDGLMSGTPANVSAIGSMTTATKLVVGGDSDFSQPYNDRIMWAALWKRTDWLDTHSQAAVVAARYASLNLDAFLDYESNLIVDGDAEASGVSAWTANDDAALSKDTTAPKVGLQSLRVAYGGTALPYASQSVLTPGIWYRVTGFARGDNSVAPSIKCGASQAVASFTADSDWQAFDERFEAAAADARFYCLAASAGHVEYDQVSIQEIH